MPFGPNVILLTLLVLPANSQSSLAQKPGALHYVKGRTDSFKPHADVTITRNQSGTLYESSISMDRIVMTMTVNLNSDGKFQSARCTELNKDATGGPTVVNVGWRGGESLDIERKSGTEFLKVGGEPIVTTTPDWSDVWQLLQRYDHKKSGKQEFPAAWVHPTDEPLALTFSIELIDNKEAISLDDRKMILNRYVMKLRRGEYLVWTDSAGTVIKIVKNQPNAPVVVLDGYQEATAGLGPK